MTNDFILKVSIINNCESYIAGDVALNALIHSPRISQDIDFFHDTQEALQFTWESDLDLLKKNNYTTTVLRERPSLIECNIQDENNSTIIQWVRDSAFRFFPLIYNKEIGISLPPFDSTNRRGVPLWAPVNI